MVLPDRLMQKCENQILHFSSTVSRIDQMILNQFLKDGYYERHLNRMRIIYGKRHDFLLKELKKIKGCRRKIEDGPDLYLSDENPWH